MNSVARKKTFSSTGVYLFLSMMFTRRAASRLLVGAFHTRSTSIISRGISSRFSSDIRPRWLTTQGVARVDEDLDAALDSLLGSAFDEADDMTKADAVSVNAPQPAASVLDEVSVI